MFLLIYFKNNSLIQVDNHINKINTSNYIKSGGSLVSLDNTLSAPVYGVTWDGSLSTSWTRTDDAKDFGRVIVYTAGSTDYSSPFDNISPWKDMVVNNLSNCGRCVAIPKFYYKLTQNTNNPGISIKISMSKLDGFEVSPAHMDRGDGKGERDVVYVGKYLSNSSDYRSLYSQLPITNVTISVARTHVQSLGVGVYICDFLTRFTLWLLYLVEMANWNSQSTIGYGGGSRSSPQESGYTNSMPYHTGTVLDTKNSYGISIQYRNIEGLWTNAFEFIEGIRVSSTGVYVIKNPSEFGDQSKGIYAVNSKTLPGSGIPKSFVISKSSGLPTLFYPSDRDMTNTENIYMSDIWSIEATNPVLFTGGSFANSNQNIGLFMISSVGLKYLADKLSCRLMYLP